MVIGVITMKLYLPDNASLKGKRRVLRSLKDRIRNQFNVSVAEVADQEKWQLATLAVALVAPDRRRADEVMQAVLARVESWGLAEVTAVDMEML